MLKKILLVRGSRPAVVLVALAMLASGCGEASSGPRTGSEPTATASGSPAASDSALPDGVEAFVIEADHDVSLFHGAADAGVLWLVDEVRPVLYRLDIESGERDEILLAEFETWNPDGRLADTRVFVGAGSVWVANPCLGCPSGDLFEVDPASLRVKRRLDVVEPLGLTVADSALWVASFTPYRLLRMDPRTGRTTRSVPVDGPTDVDAGADRLWVLEHRAGRMAVLDPEDGRVTGRVDLPDSFADPERLSFALDNVWITSPSTGSVVRVNPETMKSSPPISVPGGYEIAEHDGLLWVAGESGLSAVDPDTNTVVREISTPPLTQVLEVGNSLWAVAGETGTVYRIDP
jgi:streptogramin lyase